jgi:Holliday junction resolvasome RuvABC DNA-binding subunit
MSRPKGYAAEEAKRAFCRELEHCMLDIGIGSKKALALRAGKDPRTMYRKFEDISRFDIGDLSQLKEILRPNPIILLKAIGYSQKEIDRAYQIAQAIGGKTV